ncbi:hypothetical protein LSTR_LSTR009100 [Laodelphax striatellus]|uniref:DUF4781 domain-containing protein n=1 Tax=Laodelphax striatellus TaxID=195883 RepID=A0A482XPM1_LAOST|nr:hypothetical protein LSTR_LSTR009100 [Laodelphax striatellus]
MSSSQVLGPIELETIWRIKARKYQNVMNEMLGNRYFDSFPKNHLREKINFGLFGPPPYSVNSESAEITDKLISQITLLSRKFRPHTDTIYMEYTFIYLRYKNNLTGIEVLFRIPEATSNVNSKKCAFVDSNGRTYEDWADYLENNQLPKCDMCFPNDGTYSLASDFSIIFAKSAACKIGKIVMKGLDVTSSVVGIATTGITLAALAVPIAGPIVVGAAATAVATCGYDIVRGVDKLVDRSDHNESIGLDDGKSRKIWFDVATSALGAVSVGGRAFVKGKSAIKLGQLVIETETMVARCIKFSSIVVSGVGIVNMLITFINKIRSGELDIIDITQLKSCFLFFFNQLLSEDATRFLIGKLASLPNVAKHLSFSSRNNTFTIVKNLHEFSRGPIGNFGLLLGMVTFSMKWIFESNLSTLDTTINEIVSIAYRTATGSMSVQEGVESMNVAYKQLWRTFQLSIRQAAVKVRDLFISHSPARSILLSDFETARELCLLSLDVIEHCQVEDLEDYFLKDIFFLVHDTIDDFKKYVYGFELNTAALSKIVNYVCDKLKQLFDSEILAYKTSLESEKRKYSNEFDVAKFHKGFKIPNGININCYYLKISISKFLRISYTEKSYPIFIHIRDEASSSAVSVSPCLEINSSKHFTFRGPQCQATLTDNQYWKMALDLSGFHFNIDDATIHRRDNYVYINLNEHPETDLIFYNTRDGDSVAGIFSVIYTAGVRLQN